MKDLVSACKLLQSYDGKGDATRELILKLLREQEQRESQAAIARWLGFAPAYINDILKGRREISLAFAERVIAMSKVEPEEVA